ncbi:MAG: U32 family peptidase [Alphaproteobacteria bacterium]|nr:U32 family peptidase [Alphaproteobacteria bacterium]
MKTELLAPAGDIEAGYAALYYGADAVYLGLQQFSARATATNFNEESLNEFVGYAHHLGRKVYVAVNTVVQEDELSQLLQTLDICSKCKVDAVIIQDLGVARVVRESYPELEMHASTQMAVHNKEGALTLQKIGFSRVVVARELTLGEIKEIAAIPNLETEAFIHGALCYSYSGLCLFSSFESGRSANRGKCLYPCRSEFEENGKKAHYFSMKDMALQEDVLKMPVTSLKIEGRKKTALYVAAVTDYYRRLLDDKPLENRDENIKQIFSRPWCKFHFKGRDKNVIERNFVGHRGLKIGKIERLEGKSIVFKTSHNIGRYDGLQIEIPGIEKPFGFSVQQIKVAGKNVFEAKAGEEVRISLPPKVEKLVAGLDIYLASSTKVKGAYDYIKPKPNEYKQKIKTDVVIDVYRDKIIATSGNIQAERTGTFEPAQQPQKTQEAIEKAFAKSGETNVTIGNLRVNNKLALFVPASLLNELRRDLYENIVPTYKSGNLPVVNKRNKLEEKWIIKTDNVANLAMLDLNDFAEIIILLNKNSQVSDFKSLPKNKVRLALPAVCRNVEAWKQVINTMLEAGFCKWEIANYWGREVLPQNGIDLSFDAPIYMFNSQATQMAKEMGASRITLASEDMLANLQKMSDKSALPVVWEVYGDLPLFTSAACIRNNSCKDCNREQKWIKLNKNGHKYEVLSKDCQTMLFDEDAYCVADKIKEINADFYRVSFIYKPYKAQQVAEIWSKLSTIRSNNIGNICAQKL